MVFDRLRISVLALAAVMLPASASTVFYCDQSTNCDGNNLAAFTTATSGLSFGPGFENFSLADGPYSSGILNVDGFTGLNFFGYSGTTQIGVTIAGNVLQQTTGGNGTTLQAQLPVGTVYAFAAHISVTSGNVLSGCFESISNVSAFNGTTNCGGQFSIGSSSDTRFIGVVSDSPLTSVFIGQASGLTPGPITIKDFEFGTQQAAQAETPEVATLVLIGTGLICMRLLRRRQKTRSARPPAAAPCAQSVLG